MKDLIEENEIPEDLIWNFDKTAICQFSSPKVFAEKGAKGVVAPASPSDTATVVWAVFASGEKAPPLFEGKLVNITLIEDAPIGSLLGMQKNGWVDSKNFRNFVETIFHKTSIKRERGGKGKSSPLHC